ncbi:MAG: hypothetical protein ACK481_03685 [Candidatus Melainabacteria bacterium]|jgi:hypothetical protein
MKSAIWTLIIFTITFSVFTQSPSLALDLADSNSITLQNNQGNPPRDGSGQDSQDRRRVRIRDRR